MLTRRELLGLAAAAILGGAVFWFDIVRPLGVASAVLYVSLIGIALLVRSRRLTLAFALAGSALTLAGFVLSPSNGTEHTVVVMNRMLALFSIWIVAISGYSHLGAQRRLHARLVELADTDALTGCMSRRRVLEELGHRVTEEARYPNPLSVLLMDVDNFKRVNDSHGHLAGDQVLRDVCDVIAGCTRAADLLGRYGGEEFIVVCPNTDLRGAKLLAERMRCAVRDTTIALGHQSVDITISVGVAEWRQEMQQMDELLMAADNALYRAKERGRDAVELHVPGRPLVEAPCES